MCIKGKEESGSESSGRGDKNGVKSKLDGEREFSDREGDGGSEESSSTMEMMETPKFRPCRKSVKAKRKYRTEIEKLHEASEYQLWESILKMGRDQVLSQPRADEKLETLKDLNKSVEDERTQMVPENPDAVKNRPLRQQASPPVPLHFAKSLSTLVTDPSDGPVWESTNKTPGPRSREASTIEISLTIKMCSAHLRHEIIEVSDKTTGPVHANDVIEISDNTPRSIHVSNHIIKVPSDAELYIQGPRKHAAAQSSGSQLARPELSNSYYLATPIYK